MYRYLKFIYNEFKEYSIQIFIYSLIKTVKLLGLSGRFNTKYILNDVMLKQEDAIDNLIHNQLVEFTDEDEIIYKLFTPLIDNYPSKTILFIGGRNNFMINYNFCKMVCENIGIKIICFQYEGLYKSGKQEYLCHDSYIRSIERIYNKFVNTTDLYIIGYSLGTYGAFYINERNKLMLISPIYSLKKAVHDVIDINGFCLNSLLPKKPHISIDIHTFIFDCITFVSDLKDNFLRHNININKYYGHHVTGITEFILPYVKKYIDEN